MKDFLLDEDGDLLLSAGDLVIGDSSQQNKRLLILLPKGALKEFPEATIGAMNFLESEDPSTLLRETRVKFAADGMNVKKVGYDSLGRLVTDADY